MEAGSAIARRFPASSQCCRDGFFADRLEEPLGVGEPLEARPDPPLRSVEPRPERRADLLDGLLPVQTLEQKALLFPYLEETPRAGIFDDILSLASHWAQDQLRTKPRNGCEYPPLEQVLEREV